MEIINSNVATLSNFEVMNHLHKVKYSSTKNKGQLATITYETLRYLENNSCAQQMSEDIKSCIKALEPYNLNKNEKLMLINSPPTTALEIQLIIEESEERLTESQVEEILEIIIKYFPHIQKNLQNNTQKGEN